MVSLRRRGPGLRNLRALFRCCLALSCSLGGLPYTRNTAAEQLLDSLLKKAFCRTFFRPQKKKSSLLPLINGTQVCGIDPRLPAGRPSYGGQAQSPNRVLYAACSPAYSFLPFFLAAFAAAEVIPRSPNAIQGYIIMHLRDWNVNTHGFKPFFNGASVKAVLIRAGRSSGCMALPLFPEIQLRSSC